MSIISLFFQDEINQLVLSTVALLITFYALGRIAQGYFRFHKSNIAISIPLGLMVFLVINQLVYTPIIITDLGVDVLSIIDTLKSIIIILFIAISYEQWFPKFSSIGTKSAAFITVNTLVIVFVYFVLILNFPSIFSTVNNQWVYSINLIGKNEFYNPINIDGSTYVLGGYQSTYYWIYLNSVFANGDVTIEWTSKVVNYYIAIVWIICVTLAIQFTIVNNEKTFISNIISLLVSLLAVVGLSFISPTTNLFYTSSIAIIISMLLFDYAKRTNPTETIIYVALLSTITFTTVGQHSFSYLLVFGFMSIILSMISGGNIVGNTISYISVFLIVTSYYIFSLFIHDINYIKNIIVFVALIGLILMLLLIPLYSLGYTQSRREELVGVEKRINKSLGRFAGISTLVLTLFALFINFINETSTVELLNDFFIQFNVINESKKLGVVLYLTLILVPLILISILYFLNKRNKLLTTFLFLNLILNPIVLSTAYSFLSISFTGDVLLIPSLMTISLFMLNELIRRVPALH